MIEPVICTHCDTQAELTKGSEIYPHRPDLFDKNFWQCKKCRAYVGCHRPSTRFFGIEPLGTPANKELRRARNRLHDLFDPIWNSGAMSRSEAYRRLASAMDVEKRLCHIGMFDLEDCAKATEICRKGGL